MQSKKSKFFPFVNNYVFFNIFLVVLICSCDIERPVFKKFQVNSLDKVITKSNLNIDDSISYDGLGSIRVDSEDTTIAYLYMVDSPDLKNAELEWKAYIKTEDLEGKAFLEMGVLLVKKKGKTQESYLNYSENSLTGTNDWRELDVNFLVRDDYISGKIQLNLIVIGRGHVWIDQVRFSALPQ